VCETIELVEYVEYCVSFYERTMKALGCYPQHRVSISTSDQNILFDNYQCYEDLEYYHAYRGDHEAETFKSIRP